MTDSHRTDLVYGHLGEPRYVSELKKWEFARNPENGHRLEQIGPSKITVLGTSKHQDLKKAHLAAPRDHDIKLLAASDPFLTPASSYLAPLAQVSEIVNDSVAAYDPLIGNLLAFGKAKFEEPHPGTKSVDIVATVTGARGENVRLVRLTKERIRGSASKNASFEVSTLEGGECSVWLGPGSPLQHICFSVSLGRSSPFLAVRTLLSVTILRPTIRHGLVPTHSFHRLRHHDQSHLPSRIDPNPIATMSLQDVAGIPFADVTFNPWFDEQFGIVDQQGQWAVFEIDRDHGVKRLIMQNQDNHHHNRNHGTSKDHWGKLLWVANVNTLALARRNYLNIYDIKSRTPIPATALQKFIKTDRVLDVTGDLRDHSMLYVLTSTKVFWIEIQATSDHSKEHQANTTVILSFWHYRSFNDLSLRLSMAEQDDSTLLLIWSHAATLVTIFTLRASIDREIQQSCWDTYGLVPDLYSGAPDPKYALQNTGYRALHLRKVGLVSNPVAQYSSFQSTVEIFQLFLLHPTLSISESFHQHTSSQDRVIKLADGVHLGQAKANLKSSTQVQDLFLVPNALCSEDEESFNDNDQPTQLAESSRKSRFEPFEDPFTINVEWLTKALNRAVADVSTNAANPAFESCANLFNHLEAVMVNSANDSETSLRLPVDAFEDRFTVSDLDSTSQVLNSIFQHTKGISRLENELEYDVESLSLRCTSLNIQSLSSMILRHDSQSVDMTLLDIYNRLVKCWISSLSPKMPSRSRVNLNRMLRTIALQVYLSFHSIENTASGLPAEPELPELGTAVEFPALTVRSKTLITPEPSQATKDSQEVHEKSRQDRRHTFVLPEASLPTPAQSRATSSQRSVSSDPTVPDESYTRLSALAHLDFQPVLQDTGQRLLSHWEMGTDPSAYDWAAKKEVYEREELDAQLADDPEALKQKRRREKRMKRQAESSQKAAASSSQHQPMSLPTAQLPGAGIRSDPITRPSLGFSSQPAQRAMPFTQEEPGRFGGRPEKKAARPARRQGF